ncbi:MAG: PDZ domain-containing protein [Planctomycetaceae bacterium]|nr:PDZ domain-containing protein [Planctomycetaceae bacterium]
MNAGRGDQSHLVRTLRERPAHGCCRTLVCGLAMGIIACLAAARQAAADDTAAEEQAAFAAAVARVAPSVVQIETVGGKEQVEGVLLGTGPTTGLIVDSDGYIISSAFNFIGKPASIVVRLPGGTRKAARLVATDHARMLVLLKIDAGRPLPTCAIAARAGMHVGQWAIAVGRTFQGDRPNMAVGVLSALDRVWGRAIQTDAAVSPNNYGGPLVDIHGRVMGVLAPLSPQAGEVAGVDLYDSGIGFAVPAEDIQRVLPRLKKGEDLQPGLAGMSIKGANQFTAPPIVAACRTNSPAAVAGIKVGDRIVELGGRAITRAIQIRDEFGRRYSGDKVSITVVRDNKETRSELQLVATLEPFQHGFLGVLPMRGDAEKGVAVRYVYPKSPAAAAGIVADDILTSLGGEPVRERGELIQAIGMFEPGSEVELGVLRGDARRTVKVTLGTIPEELPPDELPAAWQQSQASATKTTQGRGQAGTPGQQFGAMRLKIAEYDNKVWAYVPAGYDPARAYGVVVWLHAPGGYDWKELLARWQPLCDRHDLILVAPKSSEAARWMPEEAGLVDRLLMHVGATYHIDPARVVVHGYEGGGAMAFLTAFRNRQMIRAVAAVQATPVGAAPENDPLHRLAVYLAAGDKTLADGPIGKAAAAMRRMKIPVTTKSLGQGTRYLNADELSQLARWIDMLDRI